MTMFLGSSRDYIETYLAAARGMLAGDPDSVVGGPGVAYNINQDRRCADCAPHPESWNTCCGPMALPLCLIWLPFQFQGSVMSDRYVTWTCLLLTYRHCCLYVGSPFITVSCHTCLHWPDVTRSALLSRRRVSAEEAQNRVQAIIRTHCQSK